MGNDFHRIYHSTIFRRQRGSGQKLGTIGNNSLNTQEKISKSDALLRESIPYSLLISFATPPLIMIATVLFAVAQSVRDTSAAMPSWADLFPLIILRSLEISHSIPP